MHILFLCVNYNTLQETCEYLNSINNSYNKYPIIKLDIIIADNSLKKENIELKDISSNINVKHLASEINRGYFGAIQWSIDESNIDLKKYDYIITSNVDIKIEEDFFLKLSSQKYPEDTGIIAPAIFSKHENCDRNPKILSPLTKMDMLKYKILYSIPYLHFIYSKYIYAKKKNFIKKNHERKEIYAPHGSFMIFCNKFFQAGGNLNYPCFLFGEEIFFAEISKTLKLKVFYDPQLIVEDKDHVSTSLMKSNILRKYNLESITYLKNTFFK